ncbi:hypothetical protein Tsp_11564 [Trichinella spiralis]|uniref:hypothetical protein n=1 Tax=Trichinella spiralis TaxID=6334 RepID=UPI0001EFE4F7|nr:hypothetical protein Tsp_11564 [Trichinella spiralis]
MRVVRQSLSCGGMYLASRRQLKAFARHTGSHCRRCDTWTPSRSADVQRNLVCGDGEQNAFRVEWAFGFEGPCINTGALTYSLSQSGLCGIDGATYITEGLILNEVGRNSFGVTLEERLHLRVLASDLLSSVLRFFPSTLLPGRWGLMTFRFAQELDEYADSSVNMRPSHPPGVYGVHPLGPDPIPARLASHRDVVGMGCSDPRSPSASEKSHTPESAPVP